MKRTVLGVAIGILLCVTAAYAAKTKWPWHPVLQKAENQLRNAKTTLEHATHDCGGHRVKAIGLIDQAMAEVKAGRDYANAHPEEAIK